MKKLLLIITLLTTLSAYECVVVNTGSGVGTEDFNIQILNDDGTVHSEVEETIPVAIQYNTFYSGCVVFDEPEHVPVQGTEVKLTGQGWEVLGTTNQWGCWHVMLPSNAEFSLRVIDPRSGNYASYSKMIKSRLDNQSTNMSNILETDKLLDVQSEVIE